MFPSKDGPPSLCILFYRHTDVVETRKSLGLAKLKDEAAHPNEENELEEVLRFATDGSTCRGSTLLGALGKNAPSWRCGGVECCDNCRFRLGLECSPLALKDDSRSVSMGLDTQATQKMMNCNLDVTSYVLETLQKAKVSTTRSKLAKNTLVNASANVWDGIDRPASSSLISGSEWDRISPIRGICLKSFFRCQLFHLLLDQGVIKLPTKEAPKRFGIGKVELAQLMSGRTKILVRNVRLFQSYLKAPTFAPAIEAAALAKVHRAAPIGSVTASSALFTTASRKDKTKEDKDLAQDLLAFDERMRHFQDLLAFDELMSQYLAQDESHLPVKFEELRAIDNGATFFPRLTIPLGSLSWITTLPYLVQYEIWRLWNAVPRKLTMGHLTGPVRKYLEENPTTDARDACNYIYAVINDSSVQTYENTLKSRGRQGLHPKAPITFLAELQSTGDKLSLQPPLLTHECRVFRKFGSSRFLRVLLPTKFLGAGTQPFHTSPHGFDDSGAMLNTPLYLAGRYYRYIFPDLPSDKTLQKSLVFFAERGTGIAKQEEMTVDDVREWCIPTNLNKHLTVVDEQLGMNICFSESIRCCSLPSDSVTVEEGPAHDADGMKFNGGCGRISQAALDLVWASWSASQKDDPADSGSCPCSSFEGAIGGMRGVWVLDKSLGDGIKVICRPSQQVFNLPMKCLTSLPALSRSDDAYDTVEVHNWDGIGIDTSSKQRVSCRFIQAVEHRGVPAETLRSCVEMACSNEDVSSLREIKAQAEYPLEKCRSMRLIPDHTGLLKPGEAFLATREFPLLEDSRQVMAFPWDPAHGQDIVKLNLITHDVLRERDLAAASAFSEFFCGLQTGIVLGQGCRDPSEQSGGEYFGKVRVCWLEQIVNKLDEASSVMDGRARQSPRPQVDEICLRELHQRAEASCADGVSEPEMTGQSCTTVPGQYLFRKLKQDWFLAQMHDLLTILNDLKGPNCVETLRIASVVDEIVSFCNVGLATGYG
jgi:hypothetical protein